MLSSAYNPVVNNLLSVPTFHNMMNFNKAENSITKREFNRAAVRIYNRLLCSWKIWVFIDSMNCFNKKVFLPRNLYCKKLYCIFTSYWPQEIMTKSLLIPNILKSQRHSSSFYLLVTMHFRYFRFKEKVDLLNSFILNIICIL